VIAGEQRAPEGAVFAEAAQRLPKVDAFPKAGA
jgi:hypothetical protein